VYEYLTEGGITRFTAIYLKPSGSEKVGPVRSARLVSLRLVRSYQGVLFYSGASDHVLGQINDTHVPALDENSDGGKYMSRDPSRQAPHNLYTSGDQLKAGLDKVNAKVTYQLPAHGEPTGQGDPVQGLSFDQTFAHPVKYAYSAADKTYTYTTDTGVETDQANGNQPLRDQQRGAPPGGPPRRRLHRGRARGAGHRLRPPGHRHGRRIHARHALHGELGSLHAGPALCAWSAPTARTSRCPRV